MIWLTRVKRCQCSQRLSTRLQGKPTLAVAPAGDKLTSHKSLSSSMADALNVLGIFLYIWENTTIVDF